MKTNLNKSHWIGFLLSIVFTIIPFYIIKYNIFEKSILYIITIFCAVVQIYTHLIYFLNFGSMSNPIWNIISLIFTVFILLILIFGSIWIMIHLHHNLMI